MEPQKDQPSGKQRRRLIKNPLRLLGFWIAIVILGPLNPIIRPEAVEQQLGIQDGSWQEIALIGVWVAVIFVLYSIFLGGVEFATKRRALSERP